MAFSTRKSHLEVRAALGLSILKPLQELQLAKSPLGVQVIARAAEVLRALEGREQGVSLGQLARQLGLAKSTVQRIVAALEQENFVISASPQGGVRLGPALVRIGRSVRFGLTEVARPSLMELAQRTGETVDLAVRKGARAIFLDHIESSQRLRTVSAMGLSFPLYCTANGKAMLAALSADELAQLKRTMQFTLHTPNSIGTWNELEKGLAEVRQSGLAFDHEEHTLGISAVGIAITGPSGENAAISIPTPSVRFTEKLSTLKAALLECRKALQERISQL